MDQGSLRFQASKYPFGNCYFQDSAIYNTDEYLSNYPTDNLYRLTATKHGHVLGQLNLYIKDHEAINAPYSGFGGIEHCLSEEREIQDFISYILEWCMANKLKQLNLKLPPPVYFDNVIITEIHLLRMGFKVLSDEVNQHIEISEQPYTSKINSDERRKITRCKEMGFVFRNMEAHELEGAYKIIKDNRVRKGFPITMTFEKLQEMYRCFEKYMLFGVFDNNKLIATSVSIHVTEHILYNFYHGDLIDYRKFSPTVMLLEGIYGYCRKNNLQQLDIGISSVDGAVNEGLYIFKKNCGAIDSSKKKLVKIFEMR